MIVHYSNSIVYTLYSLAYKEKRKMSIHFDEYIFSEEDLAGSGRCAR